MENASSPTNKNNNARATRAERTFLSNAAHEFRTPLHSASGFVEMVLDGLAGPLTERQREMLGYTHTAIGQLHTLLEDVFFCARVDSGELLPHFTKVDPAIMLASAIESIHEQARDKHIAFTQEIGDLPKTIRADGERVREGLAGFLRGALALAPAHSTLVIVASVRNDLFSAEVALSRVRLRATDMRHLFDRFYQPHPLGAERSVYLGLGLAVAQTTASWHGGNTWADSAPDGSVILHYELPLGDS